MVLLTIMASSVSVMTSSRMSVCSMGQPWPMKWSASDVNYMYIQWNKVVICMALHIHVHNNEIGLSYDIYIIVK